MHFSKKLCIGYLHFKISLYPDYGEGVKCLKLACERHDHGWVLLSWNIPCREHSLHPRLCLCGREVPAASYCSLRKKRQAASLSLLCDILHAVAQTYFLIGIFSFCYLNNSFSVCVCLGITVGRNMEISVIKLVEYTEDWLLLGKII